MITIIKTKVPCNKKVGADGNMIDFQLAKAVTPTVRKVDNVRELHELLVELEDQPYRAILRGTPRPEVLGKWTTKEAHNYEFPPVKWLCLDHDDPAPEGCPDYVTDPEGTIHWMIEHKWKFLKGVGIAWQLGNSANVKPASEKMSFHLWVMLKDPIIKCGKWLGSVGFDKSLTDRSRIHYTASPEGVHVPQRMGLIEGAELEGVAEEYRAAGEIGEGVAIEWLECPLWRQEELIKQLRDATEASDGKDRHDLVRGWILTACTEGFRGVSAYAIESLGELGRDPELSAGEVERLMTGARAKIESGEFKASELAQIKSVFGDEVETEVEDPQAQKLELCGPSFLEELKGASDPLELIKNNPKKLTGLDEIKLMELEDILLDAGVLVDSKPKKGQLTRGRLGKLVKSNGGAGESLDPATVERYRENWKSTYCTEKNGAFSYFFYDKSSCSLRLASKRDELDAMCGYLSDGMKKAPALLFREAFYKEIHEKRNIDEWIAISKPFGKSQTKFEQRGDGKLNAMIESSISQHLELIKARKDGVEVPANFERFMDAEYSTVWNIMKAALARRFLGNKRSTIWLNCSSNWGKTFFFDVGDFGMSLDNGYDKDDFKGNDPAEMAKWLFIFVDESHRFTKEMKLDSIPYRRLWGGLARVTLPARILASANEIADLSDGADKQLLNRVVKIKVVSDPLEEVLSRAGWSTEQARKWYEALLSRKLVEWLNEWGDSADFSVAADAVYSSFCKECQMGDVEDIRDYIKDHFWDHFMWDHLYLVGKEYRLKDGSLSAWAGHHLYIDNGSKTEPDRRRLYLKSPDAWRDTYVNKAFGSKKFAVQKAMPSINAMAEVLGGKTCTRLPNQKSFKGVSFDISNLSNVEEHFAEQAQ